MNSVHYETLKDMVFELRQCRFKEQYEDLLHRILTFIEANGVAPRQFIVLCKWNSRSSVRGSSKMSGSGSQFNSGGGSPPSSDDGSSSDGDDAAPPHHRQGALTLMWMTVMMTSRKKSIQVGIFTC